jgi:hypothetical protein
MNTDFFKGHYICSCGAYITNRKTKDLHDCEAYKLKTSKAHQRLEEPDGNFFKSVTVHNPYKR